MDKRNAKKRADAQEARKAKCIAATGVYKRSLQLANATKRDTTKILNIAEILEAAPARIMQHTEAVSKVQTQALTEIVENSEANVIGAVTGTMDQVIANQEAIMKYLGMDQGLTDLNAIHTHQKAK